MRKWAKTLLGTLLTSWVLVALFPGTLTAQPSSPKANVILLIGDGMDDVQISIARNYLRGARG